MRLWHIDILEKLPKQWQMGQHRECCALRGNGWGKKHSVIDYVFKYPYEMLFNYHVKCMDILKSKNVNIDQKWYDKTYRGKTLLFVRDIDLPGSEMKILKRYPEHDDEYFQECILNLKNKGILL